MSQIQKPQFSRTDAVPWLQTLRTNHDSNLVSSAAEATTDSSKTDLFFIDWSEEGNGGGISKVKITQAFRIYNLLQDKPRDSLGFSRVTLSQESSAFRPICLSHDKSKGWETETLKLVTLTDVLTRVVPQDVTPSWNYFTRPWRLADLRWRIRGGFKYDVGPGWMIPARRFRRFPEVFARKKSSEFGVRAKRVSFIVAVI